jgi:hypothetical protein
MTDFLLVMCGAATAFVLGMAALRQSGVMRRQPVFVRVKRGRR